MSAHEPLAGRGIVVTRPARQAAALAALIERHGGRAILFPTIEIRDVEDRRALDAVMDRIETFDLAVFVSPNAVDKGLAAVAARTALPPQLRVAAVGRGTGRELQRRGFDAVIAPRSGDDSESLLALPELAQAAGRRVVVFRGVGGRELIHDTLRARGAHVEYAECYVRAVPDTDPGALDETWDRGGIDAFVATSSEGLRNLCTMLGGARRDRLACTPIFVTHARIAACAKALGLGIVVVTAATDEDIALGLARHFGAALR